MANRIVEAVERYKEASRAERNEKLLAGHNADSRPFCRVLAEESAEGMFLSQGEKEDLVSFLLDQ